MDMNSAAVAVAEFGAEQWGLVTSAQARQLGVTPVQMKRLADKGALERIHHGIYRMTRLPYDPRLEVRTAWIALDPRTPAWERLSQPVPEGVVSYRSAAQLHDLGNLDADRIEFTCQRRIRLGLPDVRVHIGTIEIGDWTVVDGLPVTTPLRTIADLAAEGIDGEHLADIVRDALARDQVTAAELRDTLKPFAFDYAHVLGDGSSFLDSLITRAGISENTIDLAEAYRRQHRDGDTSDLSRSGAVERLLASFVVGPATRQNSGHQGPILPFVLALPDGYTDALIGPIFEGLVGSALQTHAAAQLAPLGEKLRALAAASLDSAAMAATRDSILHNFQTPASQALQQSLFEAIQPMAEKAAADVTAALSKQNALSAEARSESAPKSSAGEQQHDEQHYEEAHDDQPSDSR